MEFYQQFEPYTEAMLLEIEKDLGTTLSPDYRAFLLEYGGGQPLDTIYERRDGEKLIRKIRINTFHGNYPKGAGVDLYRTYLVLNDRISKDFLPIAADGAGNYLCIGIRGENKDKIFMWWADGEVEIDKKPTLKNMEFIADSFNEIAANLIPEE